MNLRAKLRKWLEIDIWHFAVNQQAKRIADLEEQLHSLSKELVALRTHRRDTAGKTMGITDWETIQAHYAANPENYKEQA